MLARIMIENEGFFTPAVEKVNVSKSMKDAGKVSMFVILEGGTVVEFVLDAVGAQRLSGLLIQAANEVQNELDKQHKPKDQR